jgi:excinuclease ABC subunit B
MEGARDVAEPTTGTRGKGAAQRAALGPNATPEQLVREIKRLEAEMLRHARNLEFEEAAARRDEIHDLRQRELGLAG